MRNNRSTHGSCPYIGLSYDKATFSNFPVSNNICYHCKPTATPIYTHQIEFCLTDKFEKCPIYDNPKGNPFPSYLQYQLEKKRNFRLISLAILLIGFVFIFLWFNERGLEVDLNSTDHSHLLTKTYFETSLLTSPTITIFVKPTNVFTTQSIVSNQTSPPHTIPIVASSPTMAPTEVKVFHLETIIGNDPQFIIHRVNEGESLPLFADAHGSNVETIRAVNFGIHDILWVDQILIIPINLNDSSNIPPFLAYEVEKSTTFLEIAKEFAIPIEDLLKYNNVQRDYPLKQADWILLPQIND